jgi:hypothetical protein
VRNPKFILLIPIFLLATPCLSLSQESFHSGSAAYCEGCQTMHNSSGGKAMAKKGNSTQFQSQPYLLQGSDQSSTCLNCHAAHASGWDSISRWRNNSTFLTVAGDYPGSDAAGNGAYGEYANGRTKAETQATFTAGLQGDMRPTRGGFAISATPRLIRK